MDDDILDYEYLGKLFDNFSSNSPENEALKSEKEKVTQFQNGFQFYAVDPDIKKVDQSNNFGLDLQNFNLSEDFKIDTPTNQTLHSRKRPFDSPLNEYPSSVVMPPQTIQTLLLDETLGGKLGQVNNKNNNNIINSNNNTNNNDLTNHKSNNNNKNNKIFEDDCFFVSENLDQVFSCRCKN